MKRRSDVVKKIGFLVLFSLGFSLSLQAYDFLQKKVVQLGQPVPDFELSDLKGRPVKLSSLKGKIVMIHFWSATCPFVQRYEDRLQKLAADYGTREVVVLGIDSNANETPDQIRKAGAERKVNYPILLDPGNRIADQFGAITTPHVFILNWEGRLAYEGSVDDQGWSEKDPVHVRYAREALEALLQGREVPHPKTRTFGCTIKRVS